MSANHIITLSFQTEGNYSAEEVNELKNAFMDWIYDGEGWSDDDAIRNSFEIKYQTEAEISAEKASAVQGILKNSVLTVHVGVRTSDGEDFIAQSIEAKVDSE